MKSGDTETGAKQRSLGGHGECHSDPHTRVWPVSPEGRLLGPGPIEGYGVPAEAVLGQALVWRLARGQGRVLT